MQLLMLDLFYPTVKVKNSLETFDLTDWKIQQPSNFISVNWLTLQMQV